MKKKLAFILLAMIAAFAFVGCEIISEETTEDRLTDAYLRLTLDGVYTPDFELPRNIGDVTIFWTCAYPDGTQPIFDSNWELIELPEEDTYVHFYATLVLGGMTMEKNFEVLVQAPEVDEDDED